MGLFLENLENPEFRLSIWEAEESIDELCRLLGISPAELPSRVESRQKEWLAIRILVKRLLARETMPVVEYDAMGKPSLPGHPYSISISHTKSFVGLLLSASSSCGLDLEILHPRILKIADRFLSDEEKHFIHPDHPLPYLYVVWGAKEVLYKIYGKGDILFKKHLKVEKFTYLQEGKVTARIVKEDYSKSHTIHYRQVGDLMLTYAID